MANVHNSKPAFTSDLGAGLNASIPSVSNALASGVLAGINPIYGLYCLMIGTPIAALFTGSTFMSVRFIMRHALCIRKKDSLTRIFGLILVRKIRIYHRLAGLNYPSPGQVKTGSPKIESVRTRTLAHYQDFRSRA